MNKIIFKNFKFIIKLIINNEIFNYFKEKRIKNYFIKKLHF